MVITEIKIHKDFLYKYLGIKKEFAIYVIKIKDIILETIIILFTKYNEDNLHIYFQILFYKIWIKEFYPHLSLLFRLF